MPTTQSSMLKTKLVATAAELVYRQGWNATGINQILGDAKVPKGSFYYYFQSKEDLGVAIVKHHAQKFEELYLETFLNPSLTGRDGLLRYFVNAMDYFKDNGFRWGCPVGTFSNEVADNTQKIADACCAVISRFHDVIEQAVIRGLADGSVQSTTDPKTLALQLSSLWQGALLNMKTLHSVLAPNAALELAGKILS